MKSRRGASVAQPTTGLTVVQPDTRVQLLDDSWLFVSIWQHLCRPLFEVSVPLAPGTCVVLNCDIDRTEVFKALRKPEMISTAIGFILNRRVNMAIWGRSFG